MFNSILLVDDEEEILDVLSDLFKEKVQFIYTASSASEALKIATEESLECIVCDFKMPGEDGVSLLKNIREQGKATPVIFYTDHGDLLPYENVSELGAYDIISKADFKDLFEVVEDALKLGQNILSEKG